MNSHWKSMLAATGVSLAFALSALAATTAKVSCSGANLRAKPNTDSSVLAVIYAGETVNIKSEDSGWYYVSYGDKKGYIRQDLLTIGGSSSTKTSQTQSARVSEETVNLRSKPDVSSSIITQLDEGDSLTILESVGEWYLVSFASKQGYVRKDLVRLSSSSSASKTNVTANDVPEENTASSASKSTSKTTENQNTSAKSDSENSNQNTSAKSDSGNSKTTDDSSTKSDNRHAQEMLSKLSFYSGSIDGSSGTITTAAIKSFQRAYDLQIDGKIGADTLTLLERAAATGGNGTSAGKVAVKNGVILAEWFNFMKSEFPKYEPVLVVDVETGTPFYLRAFSKGNHADVEPPTKKDTEILYKINGNKWSWTPRPIWVYLDGKVYAAAINVQPHGSSTIDDNGMNGQICMHFLHSRTHNTGQENKNLQTALLKAFDSAAKAPNVPAEAIASESATSNATAKESSTVSKTEVDGHSTVESESIYGEDSGIEEIN